MVKQEALPNSFDLAIITLLKHLVNKQQKKK
jgi:hypothetical protein